GGVDYERRAFPVTDRVTRHPLHVRARVRTAVRVDQTCVVHELVTDHDEAAGLHDLHVRRIRRRHHRRTHVAPRYAALAERTALCADRFWRGALRRLLMREARLALRGQRRQLAVARLDDQRRAPVFDLAVILGLPDRVVVVDVALRLTAQAVVARLEERGG